jgi:hypothetical protein
MSSFHLVAGWAGIALTALALSGLVARRRLHLWYGLGVLLAVVLIHDLLVASRPTQFFRKDVWLAKETVLILVRLGMAVELMVRVFRRFPGAMVTARRLLLFIALSTALAVWALPVRDLGYAGFVADVMPRVLNGTVWLFASLAILIVWYRLPVHGFQKAILLSYVPYLLVFTVAMNALGDLGWQRGAWFNSVNPIAYQLMVLHWTYAAWRPDRRRRQSVSRHSAS